MILLRSLLVSILIFGIISAITSTIVFAQGIVIPQPVAAACPCGWCDNALTCCSCNTCEGMCDCYGLCDLNFGGTVDPTNPYSTPNNPQGYTSVPLCFGCGNPYWDGTKYICPPNEGVCWGYKCGQKVDDCWPSFCPDWDKYTGCTPACGQTSICGATCPNTDAKVPAMPLSTYPDYHAQPPNVIFPDSTGKITITWSSVLRASRYELELYPTGTSCADPQAWCKNTASSYVSTTSFPFTPTRGEYTFRIRGINTACTSHIGTVYGEWTPLANFVVRRDIAGTFYFDDSLSSVFDMATGKCQTGGSKTQNIGSQSTIQAVNGTVAYPGSISGSSYQIPSVPSASGTSIVFTPDPLLWECSCPAGCIYSSLPTNSTLSNLDFYLIPPGKPWWQTQNGLVYSGQSLGTAIQSAIPTTCGASQSCQPYFSLQDEDRVESSSGLVLTGGGEAVIDGNKISQDLRNDVMKNFRETGPREDYTYFTNQLLSIGTAPTVDFTGAKPTTPPINQKAYFADGDVATQDTWNISANEAVIIVVKGNLTITQQIHVAPGGFLAFIVKGNITIEPTVGLSDPTAVTPVVEGVYYADGQLIIQGGNPNGDLKFVGAGSFIGRRGAQLNRTFAPPRINLTAATDLFIFRPDLIANTPKILQRPLVLWQEVND